MRYIIWILCVVLAVPALAQEAGVRDVSPIIDVRADAHDDNDYLPIEYDEALSMVADTIAERILTSNDVDSDVVQTMLTDAGYQLTSFGGGWGTTFDTFDSAVQTIADSNQEMILNELITHFALGFAESEDLNAYIFLAVTFNTCQALEPEDDEPLQIEHADTMLELVNVAREEESLEPLTLDTDLLYRAARWYSDDMLEYGYPATRPGGIPHIGSDDSTVAERVEREGYVASVTRENILARWTLDAEGAFDQWWNSEQHKANMLADDVSVMALAWTCNLETGEYYYTQVFADPMNQITPENLIIPLFEQLNIERTTSGAEPLQTNVILMDYGNELAAYLYENDRFPTSLWDEFEARYPYLEAYAASASTDADLTETVAFLLDSFDSELHSDAYTDIGIGIYLDTDTHAYWYVLLLASPQ